MYFLMFSTSFNLLIMYFDVLIKNNTLLKLLFCNVDAFFSLLIEMMKAEYQV